VRLVVRRQATEKSVTLSPTTFAVNPNHSSFEWALASYPTRTMTTPTTVIVALDWTPNGNHLGFYVAKDRGFYKDAGLDVCLVSPHDAAYAGSYLEPDAENPSPGKYVTPCSKVADGSAHFGVNSPEGVVGWNTSGPERPRLKAVAALLFDRNTSAIVTLKSSGIDAPNKLDGCKYASYAARFEGRIVQKMIQADGGVGEFNETTPPMLGIWNTLLNGEADATWVFSQWEGCEAKLKNVELNAFPVCDYGMPYAYAPCLCAHPDWLVGNPETARAFLDATARGYKIASEVRTSCAFPKSRTTVLCCSVTITVYYIHHE
jgi:ABC-type nitrate/sulfonate/bicarbonate transport system substrate-binding protein